MSITMRTTISDSMKAMGLNYQYQEWETELKYPYFVGEYQEMESMNEDGMQESTFILTGFTRGNDLELEAAKEKIKEYFNPISGYRVRTSNGVLAVFYAYTLANIPTGDAELKKIQINLNIKEWKGL